MTIEETVTKLAEAQVGQESRLVRLEDAFKDAFQQVAVSIQQLTQLATTTDGRLDSLEEGQVHTDARLDALIDSTVGHESRHARLEESHQLLVQLVRIQEERLDGHDNARERTDARLDAFIDAQIGFDDRLSRLAAAQAEYRRQVDERGARLDEKLARLQEAQARTDEQIRMLLDRNGSTTKPTARVKKVKKDHKKGSAK